MKFKDIIIELRKQKNLSQSQLAKDLELNQTTISTWELGKKLPDYNSLVQLAKYFDVSGDYLLGLED